MTGIELDEVNVYVDDIVWESRRRHVRCVDLNSASRELLPALLRRLHLVADLCRRRGARPRGATGSASVEAEAGMFGRALLEGDDVIGWMQAAPAALVPRARRLPAGPPSTDAWLLTCAYFYDEEFLPGFQTLLQDVVAALKHRRRRRTRGLRPARTAAARRPLQRLPARLQPLQRPGARRQRLRSCVRGAGIVARYRLELETLIAVPRRSRATAEKTKPAPATQPV